MKRDDRRPGHGAELSVERHSYYRGLDYENKALGHASLHITL